MAQQVNEQVNEMVRVVARALAEKRDAVALAAYRSDCGMVLVWPGTGVAYMKVEPLLPALTQLEFRTLVDYERWAADPDRVLPDPPTWKQKRAAKKAVKAWEAKQG